MKHFVATFVGGLALLFGLSVGAVALPASSSAPQVQKANQAIMLKNGQKTLTIRLKANATTGYQWFLLKYDHDLLSFSHYKYMAPNTKLIGAGGAAVFTFKVDDDFIGPEMTRIHFVYVRPWGMSGATPSTVSVAMSPSD